VPSYLICQSATIWMNQQFASICPAAGELGSLHEGEVLSHANLLEWL
jgi:hypothetical protein